MIPQRVVNIAIALGAALLTRSVAGPSTSIWVRLAMFVVVFLAASIVWALCSRARSSGRPDS